MPAEKLERKVYFFRLEVFTDEDGDTPTFSIRNALTQVTSLKFKKRSTGPESRYADTTLGLLSAWPELTGGKTRVRLGRVRRSDLPRLDDGGEIKPLPIDPDNGLVEMTHMQFFPRNIVGAEFNFFGPRASALPVYFENKLPSLPHFRLRPLLSRDALRHLDEMSDVRMLSVRVRPSHADLLASAAPSVPAALRAAADSVDAGSVDIVLRSKHRKPLDGSIVGKIRRMFEASDDPLDDFESFHVRGKSGETERVETFDFLKDQFIQNLAIAKIPGRTRAVDSDSMFSGIEQAYNTLKADLEAAAAAEIDE